MSIYDDQTRDAIRSGMARAFFASAWADQCEETDNARIMSGREILNLIPGNYDPAAHHAARTLLFDMERVNGAPIVALWRKCPELASPTDFGHYCAMQAMGHGVGIFDYGIGDDRVRVPYIEFGSHSLEKDYF